MTIDFQITPLDIHVFQSLLTLEPEVLASAHAIVLDVDEYPGYPCRVSLIDARVGEQVLALPYSHHDVDSPYRASGPVFVRLNAQSHLPAINEIPEVVKFRLLSLRAYNHEHMMIYALVTPGGELKAAIETMFAREQVAYLHIHNANPGCFSCAVHRVNREYRGIFQRC
ncbi:DUF1203 domain-containing protein [Thalassomonas haliotis]|uniref:DUF1203 domain-containing protein n=1 Tax=Thalassomonas haliotis TaxID=485448 RepID=A0ABY7VL85_9GAMM|nr:DUF1203 domain-containing protein [Thalassomonas haliotis]WDE14004.1 DUF1203 domain-containing protein [Thalassomonas haliotis]